MNKSIFFGNAFQMNRVYPESVRTNLKKEAGLNAAEVYTKAVLLENPELTKETEFIFSTWGMERMTEPEIALVFPNLKCIFYSAGTVQEFARPFLNRGVKVFSAWAANAVPVAEYTMSQILLANKGFYQSMDLYKNTKNVSKARDFIFNFPGNYGCKVGLIGVGMIGTLVAQLLKQFRLEVLVFDPFLSDERAAALGVVKTSLETIFSECTTISNHLANNAQTVGMLNYNLFSLMKDRTTFLNTGRGAQVVEADLIRILKEKPTVTAVLDVTDPEPPANDSEFFTLPNLFLTPHIAGSFGDEVYRLAEYMQDEYRRYTKGEPNLYEVTPEKLATMA